MNTNKIIIKATLTVFSFLIMALPIKAVSGDVDTSFNPFVLRANRSTPYDIRLVKSVRQSDGKILISGNFSAIDAYSRAGIFRLNEDGSVDPTFDPPEIYSFHYLTTNIYKESIITGIAVQNDGKILIAGDFTIVGGVYRPKIARLNPDGSPDVAFNSNASVNINDTVFDVGVQSSGKILLGGSFCLINQNSSRCGLVRLNFDGTIDSTFADNQPSSRFRLTPDGTILRLGNFQSLQKLDVNGVVDNTFTPATISFRNTEDVFDILVEQDGSVLVAGNFEFVNGFFKRFLVKFQANGAIDVNFNPFINGTLSVLKKLPDGKILIGGALSSYDSFVKPRIARINPDGTLDNTFHYQGNNGNINIIEPLANNRFIIAGQTNSWNRLERLENNGTKDSSFASVPAGQPLVYAVAKQSDGKILVGGRLTVGGGQPRNNLVRFNSDGTLDTGFNPLTNYGELFVVNDIEVLADGKILILGSGFFTVIKLNADGTIDTTFNSALPQTHSYKDLTVIADGNLILGGSSGLAKLTANGSLDTSFNQQNSFRNAQGFGGTVNKVAVQSDGKIIAVGNFVTVNTTPRSRIVRFNQDGSIDSAFNSALGANADINDVKIQNDGKILVGGNFTGLAGSLSVRGIGRLNSDATIDSSFTQTVNENVFSIELQTDGKILIGGAFTQVGNEPRRGLARLNSNGSVDSGFQIGRGANGPVNEITIQSDGNIIIVGEFTVFNNFSKVGIARILSNSTQIGSKPFDYDGDGRADITVFRPSTNYWYQLLGVNYQFAWQYFGAGGDIVTPGDYDGDGKTDVSIFRPSAGIWVYASSANNNSQYVINWGQSGDIPLPSDFNGDGKTDFVVFRSSARTWYRWVNGSVNQYSFVGFGAVGDKPLIGDFDGDGKSDPAVFRPSTGEWFYAASSQNGVHLRVAQWGLATDKLVPADYDGDGKTDAAIYRNGLWAISNSSGGSNTIVTFGQAGDIPAAADYDGDGKADIAVFRPSNGAWYQLRSASGFSAITFGTNGDVPVPSAFVQ